MAHISEFAIEAFNNTATKLLSENGIFKLQKLKGNDSIVYSITTESNYRAGDKKDVSVAKVKEGGNIQYISFVDKYAKLFDEAEIQYTKMNSGNVIRLSEMDFTGATQNDKFAGIVEHIVLTSFNYPNIGCCAKYVQCSNSGHCIHEDIFYATAACQYKIHLDNGEIFYGDNANI